MIDLYTATTPNGRKISIALEEMGLAYELHALSLGDKEQKQDWFLRINPNGRIPAIVDRENDNFAVFESGAILIYLAEKTGQLMPSEVKGRSLVLQWLMFQMSGVGPMQGQAHVFYHYAPEIIPYAIERYQKETRRLYEVLNGQLQQQDYLAGDYSIADIATYPWVAGHEWADIDMKGLTHLENWLERVGSRPAVIKGMAIPPSEEASEEEKEAEGRKIVDV